MAFKYSDIETSIIGRITSKKPESYAVKEMPEKESQYDVGLNKVLIVVAYSDSVFEPPSSTDFTRQIETPTVLCNIKSSRLRGADSIHEALEVVKIALQGFQPSNAGKLWLDKIEFEERNKEDNYWSYNVVFKCKKIQQEVPEEEQLPLLRQVTFNQEYEAPQYY